MGPTLSGPIWGGGWFRELDNCYNNIVWAIVWDPNKAIDIGEWLICGGSWLKRFYCINLSITKKEMARLAHPQLIV